MSGSVANLAVNVDTKAVSAAIKALDALAARGAAVEKMLANIGAQAGKKSAFASMEKEAERQVKQVNNVKKAVDEVAAAEAARAKAEKAARAESAKAERERAAQARRDAADRERAETKRLKAEKAAQAEILKAEKERAAQVRRDTAERERAETKRARAEKAAQAEALKAEKAKAAEAKRAVAEQEKAEAKRARAEKAAQAEALKAEKAKAAEAKRVLAEQEKAEAKRARAEKAAQAEALKAQDEINKANAIRHKEEQKQIAATEKAEAARKKAEQRGIEAAARAEQKEQDRARRASEREEARQLKAIEAERKKMEALVPKQMEAAAQRHSKLQARVNAAALPTDARNENLARAQRLFNDYNAALTRGDANTKTVAEATARYNVAMDGLNTSVKSQIALEKQRKTAIASTAEEEKKRSAANRAAQKQFEEIQSSINKFALPKMARDTITSEATKALNDYKAALANSAVGSKAAADATAKYNESTARLNTTVQSHKTLEKQRRDAVASSVAEQKQREATIRAAQKQFADLQSNVNKLALPKDARDSITTSATKALNDYRDTISKVGLNTTAAANATAAYNTEMGQLRTAVQSHVALEKQRQNAIKSRAAEENKAAADARRAEADRMRGQQGALRIESLQQRAQSRVNGLTLRADRQLSPTDAGVINSQARSALFAYNTALRAYGANSIEAARAAGEFHRTTQRLSSEVARLGGLLPTINNNARVFSAAFGAANASLGGFSRMVFSTGAALASLAGALGMREIITAGMEIDRFVNTLKTVSGASAEFSRNMNFLFKEADRIGFSVMDVGNSFARLTLAMKGAGFTSDQAREGFTNVSEAARNFGLSAADTMGIIRAFEQSMSKGKFMAEEVRNQLGDRLPVAMAALERAVAKVDGKHADLNKRFEQGTLDVARYGLEFMRQMQAMSGGAQTLERTSQTVGAAFGRFSTELVRANTELKENGFDAAVISVTDQAREFMVMMREYGVIEKFANALLKLANNLDLVAGALAGLAASAVFRTILTLALNFNAVGLAIRGIGVVAAGLGAYLASSFRTAESEVRKFQQSIVESDRRYEKFGEIVGQVNDAVARGFKTTAGAAQTDFEKLIETFQKAGHSASTAIAMAYDAQAVQIKTQADEFAKVVDRARSEFRDTVAKLAEEKFSNLGDGIAAVNRRIQAEVDALTDKITYARNENDRETARIERAARENRIASLNASLKSIQEAYDEFARGNMSQPEIIKRFEELKTALPDTLKGQIDSIVNSLSGLNNIELTKLLGQLANLSAQLADVNAKSAQARADADNFNRAASNNTDQGFFPSQFEGENPGPQNKYNVLLTGYTRTKLARNEAAGLAVLQSAFRGGSTGSGAPLPFTERDVKPFLLTLRAKEKAAEQAQKNLVGASPSDVALLQKTIAEGKAATAVLKDYQDALDKGLKVKEKSREAERKYIDTLKEEIEQHDELVAGYNESTKAGKLAEAMQKAHTQAVKYTAREVDAQGNAIGKYKEEVEKLLPLILKRTQQEADMAAVMDKRKLTDEIVYMEKEKELVGQTAEYRERELAALKARQQHQGASPEKIKEVEELARKQVTLQHETRQLENSYNELGKIGEQAFDRIGSAITEAFAKGELRALNFGNIARAVFSEIAQAALRLAIINPILNSVFGGDRGTLSGIIAALGSRQSEEGDSKSKGGGSSGSLSGLGSVMGDVDKWFTKANEYLFGTKNVVANPAIPGGIQTAGTPGFFGSYGGASLGKVFGGIGLGMGAGSMLNGLLGGNQMGGTIGSGLGSAAGALMASAGFLGPLGPVAAGLLGGLFGGGLGGMFGPKPSVKGFGLRLQSAGYGPDANPTNSFANELLPIDYRFFNESGAAVFREAEQVRARTNEYLKQRKLQVRGVSVIGGNKNGADYSWADAGSVTEAFTRLNFRSKDNEELNKRLENKTFDGIEALQKFVDGFIEIQDLIKSLSAPPVSEFTQQINDLVDKFAEATAKAREYSLSETELVEAREKQIAALEAERVKTIQYNVASLATRKLVAQGNTQEAERIRLAVEQRQEVDEFTKSMKALGMSAAEQARMLVELEQVQALERAKIIKESTRDLRGYLDSLQVQVSAGTSPQSRLDAAQSQFTRDLELAKKGDAEAFDRITNAATTLLTNAQEFYATSQGYHDIRKMVIDGLEGLNLTLSDPNNPVNSVPDLTKVGIMPEMSVLHDETWRQDMIDYNKRFNGKLADLLPVNEAVAAATQATAVAAAGIQDQLWEFYGGANGSDASNGNNGGAAASGTQGMDGGDSPGGGSFKLGGTFYNGRQIHAYANGGLPEFADSPTLAPMALFGEAGPEAIMPLSRDSKGRLGVTVSGSGDGSASNELRAIREEIAKLIDVVADSDSDDAAMRQLVEVVGNLIIQIGSLREEMRTSRLRQK